MLLVALRARNNEEWVARDSDALSHEQNLAQELRSVKSENGALLIQREKDVDTDPAWSPGRCLPAAPPGSTANDAVSGSGGACVAHRKWAIAGVAIPVFR